MSYPLYGNVIVDSSNNNALGGTLIISNSCNTHALGNQSSIAFGVADISYGTLNQGLYSGAVDYADARITSVIDNTTPNTGVGLTFNISPNTSQPSVEALRIASSGNVGLGQQNPQYTLDINGNLNASKTILANGIKSTSILAISNITNPVNTSDFIIGEGTNSSGGQAYGQNNIFIGNPSKTISTASFNVAVGNKALGNITTGGNNVAVGFQALGNVYIGGNNVAIGANSMGNVQLNVNNCTAIGGNTFNGAGTYNQSTAIGYNAMPTASNQIVLGTASEIVIIPGSTPSTSITTGALQLSGGASINGNLYVGGNSYIGNVTSVQGYGFSYSSSPTYSSNQIGYSAVVPFASPTSLPTTLVGMMNPGPSIPPGVWIISFNAVSSYSNTSIIGSRLVVGDANNGFTYNSSGVLSGTGAILIGNITCSSSQSTTIHYSVVYNLTSTLRANVFISSSVTNPIINGFPNGYLQYTRIG